MNQIAGLLSKFAWLGLLWVFSSSTLWANTLLVDGSQDKISALAHINYLIDPSGKMTPQDVSRSQLWQPLTQSNLGYIKSPVWTYLSLQNTSNKTLNLVLYNPRAGMDHIHLHILENNQLIHEWLIGDLYPAENHIIVHRYSAIPLTLKPNQQIAILSQLKSTGPVEANWMIRSTADFAHTNIQTTLLWGLLIGLVLMLIMYHLNLYFSLKLPALLIFVGMVFFGAVTQLSINGFFRNIDLLADWQEAISLISWMSYGLSLLFLAWFAIAFFDTRKTMPYVHKLLLALIVVEILVLVFYLYAILFDQTHLSVDILVQLITLAAMLIPFMVAFLAIRLQLAGAHFYLADQFVLVIANAVQIATFTGLLELTELTALLPMLAYVSHTIFIALAIGQRISRMQDQRQKHHQLLLTQSRLSNIGQTFGNITHQAKLPLARLGSQISLMQGLNQEPSEAHYQRMQSLLPSMREQVDLLQTTVEDFKHFYNAPLRIESVSIGESIQQVLDLLSGKLVLTRTEVRFVNPFNELKISTDASAFSHVMMILLDNALDILLERQIENSVLTIGYDVDQGDVIIWIRDQAGGIKIKPIERIFENFVSDKQQGGTGIGLSIAKLMVEDRLLGRIKAANTPDGAQFTLWLHDLDDEDLSNLAKN